jgi:hypothetical protein
MEVCWPAASRQKGSVENLVGWVLGSFFKQRRFVDDQDLRRQLAEPPRGSISRGEQRSLDRKCHNCTVRSPGPGRRRRPQGRSEATGLDAGEHGATV